MVRKATTKGAASASVRPMARFCARMGAGDVAGGDAAAHLRQQHGAGRDADHAERQLVDPVGIVERDTAPVGRNEAMIVSANMASCTPAEPMTAGPSALKKCFMAGSKRGASMVGATPARCARDPDQQQFEDARDRRRPRRPHSRHSGTGTRRQRRHDGDVEQHGRGRRGREALMGVEDRRRGSSPG